MTARVSGSVHAPSDTGDSDKSLCNDTPSSRQVITEGDLCAATTARLECLIPYQNESAICKLLSVTKHEVF